MATAPSRKPKGISVGRRQLSTIEAQIAFKNLMQKISNSINDVEAITKLDYDQIKLKMTEVGWLFGDIKANFNKAVAFYNENKEVLTKYSENKEGVAKAELAFKQFQEEMKYFDEVFTQTDEEILQSTAKVFYRYGALQPIIETINLGLDVYNKYTSGTDSNPFEAKKNNGE